MNKIILNGKPNISLFKTILVLPLCAIDTSCNEPRKIGKITNDAINEIFTAPKYEGPKKTTNNSLIIIKFNKIPKIERQI